MPGEPVSAYRVSPSELESELSDHVGFLLSSAAAYDAGELSESKRLAVELRVLLQDSLLENLGVLSAMPFYDTCHPYAPDNALPHYGLVSIRYSEVLAVFDKKGAERRFVAFRDWADAVVLSDGHDGTLSRINLIKTVADKRGAHVDLKLPPLYAHLTDSRSAAYRSEDDFVLFRFGERAGQDDDDASVLPEPVAPTLRQLAHEVLVSIALQRPGVFARASDLEATLAPRHSPVGIRGVFMSRESSLVADGPLTFGVRRSVRSVDGESLG